MDLRKLTALVSSQSGSDKALMLVQYVSKFAANSSILASPLQPQLRLLAATIGDARILARYNGLLQLYSYAQTLPLDLSSLKSSNGEQIDAILEWAQTLALAAYYPLEHAAYLMWHEILPPSIRLSIRGKTLGAWDGDAVSRFSCRFWAAYVVLRLYALFRQRTRLAQAIAQKQHRVATATDNAGTSRQVLKKSLASVNTSLLVELCYLPLTVHWSRKQPFVSEATVGMLGALAAWIQLRSVWQGLQQ